MITIHFMHCHVANLLQFSLSVISPLSFETASACYGVLFFRGSSNFNDVSAGPVFSLPLSPPPSSGIQICRQSFMKVSNDAMLMTHVNNKHGGKKTPAECFPGRLS